MSSSTIISYWKPEVAIRIVTDWTHYPIPHIPYVMRPQIIYSEEAQKALSRGKSLNNEKSEQMAYQPALHADEIGLTSDKYVPLNDTVTFLPMKISYAPMSMQVVFAFE